MMGVLAIAVAGLVGGFPYGSVEARRFAMPSASCVLEDRHLWAFGRSIAVRPGLGDVGGIQGFFAPPVAGGKARVSLEVDGRVVPATDYEWRPGEFVRSGQFEGLEVASRLVASPAKVAILTLRVTNSKGAARSVALRWKLDVAAEELPSERWGWSPPDAPQKPPSTVEAGALAFQIGKQRLVVAASKPFLPTADGFAGKLRVPARASRTVHLTLNLGDKPIANPERAVRRAQREIGRSLKETLSRFPRFRSSDKALAQTYDRAALTYWTCLWDSDAFRLHPHISESGIDGGAICNYTWSLAYIGKALPLVAPEVARAHIAQSLLADPFHHYAFTPLDGKPVGPWYSYNQYSIVSAIFNYVRLTGDVGFLDERVGDRTVWEWALANATYRDDISRPVELIDYGTNENLLELHRTHAYEHFVPSPNAERYWSYRAVDALARLAGKPSPGLSARADALQKLLSEKLWRPEQGWFGTLDAEGKPHTCATIQVFDMLRLDVLTPEQQRAIVRHLNPSEFLSDYGVHSLAKTDPGYDPSDVDWGGPGVYAGDAPELFEDLVHAGFAAEGDDVLRRIRWWGSRFPYIPQAVRADAEDYRRDGRPNEVAALKVNEGMLFGLLGLEVGLDGSVSIAPHLPSWLPDYAFDGVSVRGLRFSVSVKRDGFEVRLPHGRRLSGKLGGRLRLAGAPD